MSKATISTITDKVMDGMAEWSNRPLDRVYPVLFVDAINVKIRDGKVANRPIYVVMAVTAEGHRDILGIWAGDGGERVLALSRWLTGWEDLRVDHAGGGSLVSSVPPSYRGHRYPVEVISHCVWLYFRFPLSFREVEG